MGVALYLNQLESPSSKDALCQVWFKQAQRFLRRFFNFVNVFSLFRNYLPLEKGVVLYMNKHKSPSPKDALCQVRLKLAGWFFREKKLKFRQCIFAIMICLPLEKGVALRLNKLESPFPKDALCQV